MIGLAILLGFNLVGVALSLAGVPLPGNVLGLILFTACLFAGVVKVRWVEQAGDFLLRHMLLFFAPVVVGSVEFADVFGRQAAPVVVGMVGSLLAVMLVTGGIAQGLLRGRPGAAGAEGKGEATADELARPAVPPEGRP